MPKITRIFIITLFVLSLSIFANAQQIPPSYGFVEVVDSNNKPVADASVCRDDCEKVKQNQAYLIEKTNQKGLMEKGIHLYDDAYKRPFSIYKDGYYPFFDIFRLFKFLGYGWKNNRDKPLKIELLKIPQSKNEKKLIGNEQLKREFFLSIYNKDTDSLRKLLKEKIDPNLKTSDLRGVPVSEGVPAIVYAADLANIEAIKELLSAGISLRTKDSPENKILLNYLFAGPNLYSLIKEKQAQQLSNYEKGVETLINAGANVYVRNERNNSLLMIAAQKGYLQIAETLLKNGLSNNEKNQKDLALITAIRQGFYENRFEMAQLLLKNGANPNFLIDDYYYDYDTKCTSALISAVENLDLQTVELLLAKGADVNLSCKNGESVFTKALSPRFNYYDKSAEEKREKILNLVFANGLNVKAVDNWGITILMKAIQYQNFPVIERLIKMGVDVNAKGKRGETALILAAGNSSPKIVEMLVEAGADVNAAYEYTNESYGKYYYFCYTPLTYAALGISDDPNAEMNFIVDYLISRGANVNYKCSNGETALTIVARATRVGGIKKLIELGANVKDEQGTLALKYAEEQLKQAPNKERAAKIIAILEAAGVK